MNALTILGEIKKQQTILQVTRDDLIRITGWSSATYKRRMAHPEAITLGELTAICNYLNIKSI